MAETWTLVLSCEHGGNRVPQRWRPLFSGGEEILATHRGYDIGIAPYARRLAAELNAPLHLAEVTRLLVELNRSPAHPALFSEFSRGLAPARRRELLESCYLPYREAVTTEIEGRLATGHRVCHIALHSFTPVLHGELRNADVGLLYDPRRPLEMQFCKAWQQQLARGGKGWRVRRNYPYRGAADSLVTWLRRRLPADRYLGLELELNQCWPQQGGPEWEALQRLVTQTLRETLQQWSCDAG